MDKFYFIGFAAVLVAAELGYFQIARKFNILDRPNDRSLHEKPTIRGGGIIFPIAILLFFVAGRPVSAALVAALLALAAVGLWDDIKGLGRTVRFGAQALSVLILFYDLNVFARPLWLIVLLLLSAIATVNAYNFMDGINGITGGYSLVVLGSMYYINAMVIPFVSADLLLVMMLALGVFSFFNFRSKAICFAGDVGSLSTGLAVIYLILKLIMVTDNYIFVLLLAVYGTDSFLTIIHRFLLRQNIFKAHRLHLYQVIISSTGMPHLAMSITYMILQAVISAIVITFLHHSQNDQYMVGVGILVFLAVVYGLLKRNFYKSPQS